jgi:hypothetical protein
LFSTYIVKRKKEGFLFTNYYTMENKESLPELIFCKPFDANSYMYSFNMDKFHGMERYEFKNWLYTKTQGIKYKYIVDMVDKYKTFLIDNEEETISELNISEEDYIREQRKDMKNSSNYKEQKKENLSTMAKIEKKGNIIGNFFTKNKPKS